MGHVLHLGMMPTEDFRAIPRTRPNFLNTRDPSLMVGWQLARFPDAVSDHVFLLQCRIGLEERFETVRFEVQYDDVRVIDFLHDLALGSKEVAICARYSCMAGIF